MRKIIALALALAVLLCTFACGSAETDSYAEAVRNLNSFLADPTNSDLTIDSVIDDLSKTGNMGYGPYFFLYAKMVRCIVNDEDVKAARTYANALNEMPDFCEYLQSGALLDYMQKNCGITGDAICIVSIDKVICYLDGREAEERKDMDTARDKYLCCLGFLDTRDRLDAIFASYINADYDTKFNEALGLYAGGDLQSAAVILAQIKDRHEGAKALYDIVIAEMGKTDKHVHDWAEATCTLPKICKICGETEGEAAGHDWDDGRTVREATCGASGQKEYTCRKCGATQSKSIPATGIHVWDEGVVSSQQTCTASGRTTYTCRVCGEKRVEEIAKDGAHSWDDGKVTREPTCMENGTKTYTCSRCGDTRTETIAANGSHSWDGGRVAREANCTADGQKVFTCRLCGTERIETIPANGIHDWENIEGKAPTKSAEGYTAYRKCKVCGTVNDKKTMVMVAGSWSDWSTTPCSETSARDVETRSEETPVYTTYYCYSQWSYIGKNGNKWNAPKEMYNTSNYLSGGEWLYKETTTPLEKTGTWNNYTIYAKTWWNEKVEQRQTGTETTVYYRYRDYTEQTR